MSNSVGSSGSTHVVGPQLDQPASKTSSSASASSVELSSVASISSYDSPPPRTEANIISKGLKNLGASVSKFLSKISDFGESISNKFSRQTTPSFSSINSYSSGGSAESKSHAGHSTEAVPQRSLSSIQSDLVDNSPLKKTLLENFKEESFGDALSADPDSIDRELLGRSEVNNEGLSTIVEESFEADLNAGLDELYNSLETIRNSNFEDKYPGLQGVYDQLTEVISTFHDALEAERLTIDPKDNSKTQLDEQSHAGLFSFKEKIDTAQTEVEHFLKAFDSSDLEL